jgi:hypothetical protein
MANNEARAEEYDRRADDMHRRAAYMQSCGSGADAHDFRTNAIQYRESARRLRQQDYERNN